MNHEPIVTPLRAHIGPVHCGSFDYSGLYALTGGDDHNLNLFNTRTGQLVTTYKGHSWPIHCLALSVNPTASFLSSGIDKSIFLWDPTREHPIRKFYGHQHRVNAVQWVGPEETVAVSASYDRTVRFWDIRVPSANKTPIQILDEAQDSVEDVQVATDGQHFSILTSGVDGIVRQYDIRRGQLIMDQIQEPVVAITYTKDRQAYLATCLDSTLRLMDVTSGYLLNHYQGHQNNQFKIKSALVDNDSLIMSGSETGELFIWEFLSALVQQRLSLHQKSITTVAVAPKKVEKKVLITSLDGTSSIIEL